MFPQAPVWANDAAGAAFHSTAMFAVDNVLALYQLGGSVSFSNDYRYIRFAAENFMQKVIPADQNSKPYQISRMVTTGVYNAVTLVYMAYGGYNLLRSGAMCIKNIGQLKIFKLQNSNQMGISRELNTKLYSGIDVERIVKDIKKNLNIKFDSKITKEKVISLLQKKGLKIKGRSPDGKFIEFVDKNARVRAKIHPPDKVTKYNHLHLFDKKGNALNAEFKKTNRKSFESHIEIGE
jgi:hypothetical protein